MENINNTDCDGDGHIDVADLPDPKTDGRAQRYSDEAGQPAADQQNPAKVAIEQLRLVVISLLDLRVSGAALQTYISDIIANAESSADILPPIQQTTPLPIASPTILPSDELTLPRETVIAILQKFASQPKAKQSADLAIIQNQLSPFPKSIRQMAVLLNMPHQTVGAHTLAFKQILDRPAKDVGVENENVTIDDKVRPIGLIVMLLLVKTWAFKNESTNPTANRSPNFELEKLPWSKTLIVKFAERFYPICKCDKQAAKSMEHCPTCRASKSSYQATPIIYREPPSVEELIGTASELFRKAGFMVAFNAAREELISRYGLFIFDRLFPVTSITEATQLKYLAVNGVIDQQTWLKFYTETRYQKYILLGQILTQRVNDILNGAEHIYDDSHEEELRPQLDKLARCVILDHDKDTNITYVPDPVNPIVEHIHDEFTCLLNSPVFAAKSKIGDSKDNPQKTFSKRYILPEKVIAKYIHQLPEFKNN